MRGYTNMKTAQKMNTLQAEPLLMGVLFEEQAVVTSAMPWVDADPPVWWL